MKSQAFIDGFIAYFEQKGIDEYPMALSKVAVQHWTEGWYVAANFMEELIVNIVKAIVKKATP